MKYILTTLAFLMLSSGTQAEPDLREAELLIRTGKSEAAYASLAPAEFELAGNPGYDYLLGVAALETGRFAQASLIFERVLAVDPAHAAARLDIGRTYFALGDFDRAKRELLAVRELSPPPNAAMTADHYLQAIDERLQPRQTRATAYVEAGFGSDSNLTVGPRQSSVFLPVFGGSFSLNAASRQLRDDYRQTGVGGELTHSLDGRLALFAGADIKLREYRRYGAYDYANADWHAGLQLSDGRDVYRLSGNLNDYKQESDAYRRARSVGGDWRRTLDPRTQISTFGQYTQLRYVPDSLKSNDIDQWLLGGAWIWQPPGGNIDVIALSGFAGQEMEAKTRTDGDKLFVGSRIGAQKTVLGNIDVFSALGYQAGRYSRENILFQSVRKDYQYDLMLGASWRFAPRWSLRPQVSWTRNDSSLTIYDYRRYDLGVFLRRDFQ